MTRKQPCNLEIEEIVLGTVLIRPEFAPIVLSIIKPEDLYQQRHKTTLRVISDLLREGLTPDLPTVSDKLRNCKDEISASWLASLTNIIPLSSEMKQHASLIKKHAVARAQIALFSKGVEQLFKGCDPDQVVSDLFSESSKAMAATIGSAAPLADIAPLEIQRLEDIARGVVTATGILTDFLYLDRITGGFRPSELIILAARPSIGKTALAMNLTKNAALRGYRVLVFSLEMSKEALFQRILVDVGSISFSNLRNGNLSPEDLLKARKTGEILQELPIVIDDRPDLNIHQIEARTAQVSAQKKVDLIVVDYLQLCRAKAEGRFVEVSEVSRFLKGLAKKFNVPVIALSQLSRDIEKRPDPTPKLSDLRESGAIEQDADLIMFLAGKKEATVRKLLVAKHRNGPLGEMDLKFIGCYQRFEEISIAS